MKTTLIILMATTLQFISTASAQSNVYEAQYRASIQYLANNILPNGAVIASPSKVSPDYYYDWVRDTSLTMKTVIDLSYDQTLAASIRSSLQQKVSKWVEWELARQVTPKLTDLGEPKFYVTGKANNEPWGRPQNDGPAHRAQAAINLAFHWIQEGKFEQIRNLLYRDELPARTMIKRDLEYVAHHWKESSFDLWEEERAMHYYTLVSERAALMKGAKLAKILKDQSAANYYNAEANNIGNYLLSFYDNTQHIIRYALNKEKALPHKKSDLDVAVLLAAIQTYDGQFYVQVPQVVNTVNQMAGVFQKIYKINLNKKTKMGVDLGIALGRYPEDTYSGTNTDSSGNPWFLSTIALAEFACDMKHSGLAPSAVKQLDETAIKQFNRVLFHRLANGNLSEQFNRDTGFQQGAHDLTWSYTAYISAYRACFH